MRATLLPEIWVKALRADAGSAPAGATPETERLAKRFGVRLADFPSRARVHVTDEPDPYNNVTQEEWAHRDPRDRANWLKRKPVVRVKREPTCRACGNKIADGSTVIAFGFRPTDHNYLGRRAYLHDPECPA